MKECLRSVFPRWTEAMVIKVAIVLGILGVALGAEEWVTCPKSRTMVDVPGDAVLSVFVDASYGTHCNVTSSKGLQEATTALYVVQVLNKYEYVPGFLLGLKVIDTCSNETTVYKQALQAAVNSDCAKHYELGLLVSSDHGKVLEPLRNYSVLPISTYKEQNLTKYLIDVLVHYLSTRFEVIDLVLASSSFHLEYFLNSTKEVGLCIKAHSDIDTFDTGNVVIAVIGNKQDIRRWIRDAENQTGLRKTWIVLPLDRSDIDDIVPRGSLIVKPEEFELKDPQKLQDLESLDTFLQENGNSVLRTPYLLGIGKAVVELAKLLQELQKRSCTHDTSCVMPRFDPRPKQEIQNSGVYEALRILPKSHWMKYVVGMKSQHETIELAAYKIEPAKFRVTPEKKVATMPRLCVKKNAENCKNCVNFQKRSVSRGGGKGLPDKGLLKTDSSTPIFLTIVACGTFACLVIAIFIVHRFCSVEMLDGNPTLTIGLILANVFALQTVLPFCMEDDYFGAERLNSRKIFVTTFAFGAIFSILLSRALFLVFSTGSVLTSHISGYLQGLMLLFMAGVQFATSVSYFVLNTTESAVVMRSLSFIGLLGYDILLLVSFFTVSFFISHIPRNYYEGKCFFATAIGLLFIWAIWITCFILMKPEARDSVMCCGIIATAYLVILGVLFPRVYFMIKCSERERNFKQRLGPITLNADGRINTGASQVPVVYPNYSGSSSTNPRYQSRRRNSDRQRTPGYNNYGFHREMSEVDNSYAVPSVRIEHADNRRSPSERSNADSTYARPMYRERKISESTGHMENDVIYVNAELSPNRRRYEEIYPTRPVSPKLEQTEETIREEDEDEITRITKF